jgi:hypothetical protein
MFCKYCGNELTENANFCPACGQFISETKPAPEKPEFEEIAVMPSVEKEEEDNRERRDLGGSILTNAILGLVFSCTWILSLLGLIFTIVSKSKLNTYLDTYGETSGPATVGKHLGTAALALSIVMLVLLVIYIAAIAAAIAAA